MTNAVWSLSVPALVIRYSLLFMRSKADPEPLGLACVVGPALYIGFTQAFHSDWRNALRVFIPLPLFNVLIWWVMLTKNGRMAAERTRKEAITRDAARLRLHREKKQAISIDMSSAQGQRQPGFGPGRTRFTLLWKVILPKYCLPLFICTMGAFFSLLGLAPTYQALNSFKVAPKGDLNFQLNCTCPDFSR